MKYNIFIGLVFVVSVDCYTQDLNDTSKNEPKYAISRSTLGLSGSSKVISTPNGTYYVSQSIGQSSVIGTKINKNYTILQGYQQSTISVKIVPSGENELKATIYPNPFEESINIAFDDIIDEDVNIYLFDMNGRLIISKKHQASQILNIPINYISSGIYSLKVTCENKQFIANIIKK